MTLYVPQARNSEFYAKGHYYRNCPALRRRSDPVGHGGRPGEDLAPGVYTQLERNICRRCERRALRERAA